MVALCRSVRRRPRLGPARVTKNVGGSWMALWAFVALTRFFEGHLGPTWGLVAAGSGIIPVVVLLALWQDHHARPGRRSRIDVS